MVAINMVGARLVDRAQSLIVAVLLAVFAVFIAVTLADIDPDLLAFSGYPSLSKIIASVALTFFAYLGFNVITFTAGDLRDPARELPKAMYSALGVTSLIYVLIALGVFGALTVTQVIGYGETAIAEAARPALGDAGFTVMAIAALLATASSTNATLYASSNLTGMLAKQGLFPSFFGAESRLGTRAGLFITAALVLVVANLVDLSAIASVGSAVALVIFLLVGAAGYRRRADTGQQHRHRRAGDRGDRDRARVLRRRHPRRPLRRPSVRSSPSGCCRSSSTRSSDADDPTDDRQTDATAEPRHRRPAERSAAAIAGYMRAASWNRQRRDRRHPGRGSSARAMRVGAWPRLSSLPPPASEQPRRCRRETAVDRHAAQDAERDRHEQPERGQERDL